MSTQGASMLAADAEGKPLSEVITWMDNRATDECAELELAVGGEKIYRKCGWRLTPAGDAAKIMWLRANRPDAFDKAACFPSTVEFMNFRLCGEYVTDPTNAAIRQLFNIEKGDWDDEILACVGITKDRLPRVMPIGACVGRLTAEAAELLGLSARSGYTTAPTTSTVRRSAAGAVNSGDMLLATGTTWVVLGVCDKLIYTDSHPGLPVFIRPQANTAPWLLSYPPSFLKW